MRKKREIHLRGLAFVATDREGGKKSNQFPFPSRRKERRRLSLSGKLERISSSSLSVSPRLFSQKTDPGQPEPEKRGDITGERDVHTWTLSSSSRKIGSLWVCVAPRGHGQNLRISLIHTLRATLRARECNNIHTHVTSRGIYTHPPLCTCTTYTHRLSVSKHVRNKAKNAAACLLLSQGGKAAAFCYFPLVPIVPATFGW